MTNKEPTSFIAAIKAAQIKKTGTHRVNKTTQTAQSNFKSQVSANKPTSRKTGRGG
jgi:hypothetical protein